MSIFILVRANIFYALLQRVWSLKPKQRQFWGNSYAGCQRERDAHEGASVGHAEEQRVRADPAMRGGFAGQD